MASFQVLMQGLDELREYLHNLPDELNNEARGIVEQAAHDTAVELRGVYPSGPMKDNVFVVDRSGELWARFVVESRTDQATWWEYGTQNRVTQQGWNRGAEPAHHDRGLTTIAPRHRKTMRQALIALVKANGFDVTETSD